MPDKIKGTVKWFSNRKGFGFITPTSENSPTKDDIFVHQSSIVSEGESYRTLKDGFEVEFEAAFDDSGKLKALQVTSADGSPCPPPAPREKRVKKAKKESAEGDEQETEDKENGGEGKAKENGSDGKGRRRQRKNGKKEEGAPDKPDNKPKQKMWYAELGEEVRNSMATRNIKVDGGRFFLALGDARLKLGTGGYAAMAHASALLAEGTWSFEPNGKVTTVWTNVLKFDGTEWKLSSADAEKDALVTELSLTDESVSQTGTKESPEGLWGEGKSDPKDALEANGFQMRKLVLHGRAGPGGGNRRRGRRFKGGAKKEGEKTNGNSE